MFSQKTMFSLTGMPFTTRNGVRYQAVVPTKKRASHYNEWFPLKGMASTTGIVFTTGNVFPKKNGFH